MADHREDYQCSLDDLAERFVAQYRAGAGPDLKTYCQQYPQLADDIEDLFPALIRLEQARSAERSHHNVSDRICDPPQAGPRSQPLGDYRLVRVIGRGGMGIVYEALQESLSRRVALKVLSPWMVRDPRHVLRFHREARAAARLHHSNIVPVLGVGEDRGTHYLVMQLIEGFALDELLRSNSWGDGSASQATDGGTAPTRNEATNSLRSESDRDVRIVATALFGDPKPTPANEPDAVLASVQTKPLNNETSASRRNYWGRIAAIGLQAAEALAYASHQGVVHRDIKPSNLLLDAEGTLWIADFGLAKTAECVDLTTTGELVGTFRYLPPERLHGQSDIRGDVYGLGATLYELAALRPAFDGEDNAQLLRQIAESEPPPLRQLRPTIPRDLETIIVKAMARHPQDRYQSPRAMADDLRRFLRDLPISARRSSAVERAWRWCRRHPAVAVPSIAAAIFALTIVIGSVLAGARLKAENQVARDAERRASEAELARRKELFRAHIVNSRHAASSGHTGQRLDGLQSMRGARDAVAVERRSDAENFELLDAAILCLAASDVREVVHVDLDPGDASGIDLSDDFETFIGPVTEGSGTALTSVADSSRRIVLPGNDIREWNFNNPRAFDRSGKFVGEFIDRTRGDNSTRARIWDRTTGKLVFEHESEPKVLGYDIHPNNRQILCACNGDVLRLYDLQTGVLVRQVPTHLGAASLRFNSDGSLVALSNPQSATEIVETENWTTIDVLSSLGGVTATEWHPTINSLYLGTSDHQLFCWLADQRRGYFLSGTHRRPVDRIRISPDGRLLASSASGITRVRRLGDDETLLELNGHVVRFSQRSDRLAVVEGDRLVVHELVLASSYRRLRIEASVATFSSDGRWLAVSGAAGVKLFSCGDWIEQADLALDHCGPVGFDPTGSSLVTYGTFSGPVRWPILDADQVQIGPPRSPASGHWPDFDRGRLEPQYQGRQALFDTCGQLYLSDYRNGRILVAQLPGEPPKPFAQLVNANQVAISPDNQWIAAAALYSGLVRVWNASGGSLQLEVPDSSAVAFSADGKLLGVRSPSGVQLFCAGDWARVREIRIPSVGGQWASPIAFQPHGTLIAVAGPQQRVNLYDQTTGLLVAHLPHAADGTFSWLAFSPNGDTLVVVRDNTDLSIWDLRTLQSELHAEGLTPSVRLAGSPSGLPQARTTPQIIVDYGDMPKGLWHRYWQRMAAIEAAKRSWADAVHHMLSAIVTARTADDLEMAALYCQRAEYHRGNLDSRAAREDWEHALRLNPTSKDACRGLARLHVLGSSDVRNPHLVAPALAVLQQTNAKEPDDAALEAIADVRLGRPDAAQLHQLEQLSSESKWQIFADYFVALGYCQLGASRQSQAAWDRAERAYQLQPGVSRDPTRAELDALRQEVSDALSSADD